MEVCNLPYNVSFRNIRYPRIELTTGELFLVLPFNHRADALASKHKAWIKKKVRFINECLREASKKKLASRTDEAFKRQITILVKKSAEDLGVTPNNIYFRKMRTKWASLSARKNLTINVLMKSLPYNLIKYVVFHEATHLIEKRHNERFWKIISRRFHNYQELEREMFVYWFRLIRKK